MAKKYKVQDQIKFDSLEAMFAGYIDRNKGKKASNPVEYCRGVSEYTTAMVAYMIDALKGEDLYAFLAHFVPKFVAEQTPQGSPIVAGYYLDKIKDGVVEHLKDSKQLRAFPSKGVRISDGVRQTKSALLLQGMKEKGYKNERDYNEQSEHYVLTEREQQYAEHFAAQLSKIARVSQSATLIAKTDGKKQ